MNMSRVCLLVSVIGIAMVIAILYAGVAGNGLDEVADLLVFPWFHVTLIDLYAGFILFLIWLWYREPYFGVRVGMTAAVLLLGNLAAAAYVLWRLLDAQGDWRRFLLGRHA